MSLRPFNMFPQLWFPQLLYTSKITQKLCLKNFPTFWSKELWPPSSLDLNPFDFSMWSILDSKACRLPDMNLENPKAKLIKEWDDISMEKLRASCEVVRGHLSHVVQAKGGYIQ